MAARRDFEAVMHAPRESFGELISELASQSADLVRDEVALAREEVSKKVNLYRSTLTMLAIGGAVALVASLGWCAALIIFLSQWIELWLSALLVSTVLAAIAGGIIMAALSRLKRLSLKPTETLKSLKEGEEWLKEIT
jgi:hypothetical protein